MSKPTTPAYEVHALAAHDRLMREQERLAEFIAQRGLSQRTVERFELGYVSKLPLNDGDGWTIPVRELEGGATVGIRTRKCGAVGAQRYRPWAAGEPAALFWALQDPASGGRVARLVLVAGEYDAMMLWQHGFDAVSIPGISTFKDEWVALLGRAERIYVLPDNQESERKVAASIVAKLGAQASLALWAADFSGKDVSDWFIAGRAAEALAALLVDNPPPEATPPPAAALAALRRQWMISARELNHLPPTQWLVAAELPSHALAFLIGASGVGKSFLALDYAMRVAQQAAVVYVVGERLDQFRPRLDAWLQHNGGGDERLFICPRAVDLLNEAEFNEFYAAIAPHHPQLVVVDTLARCTVGADENSAQMMGMAISRLQRIQEELGATVLVVHHLTKSGQWERGSSTLRAATDTVIVIRPERNNTISIKCDKQANDEPFKPRYRRLLAVAASCVLAEADDEALAEGKQYSETLQHKLLAILAAADTGAGLAADELVAQSGASRSAVFAHLNVLKNEGKIWQLRWGGRYTLNPPTQPPLPSPQPPLPNPQPTLLSPQPHQLSPQRGLGENLELLPISNERGGSTEVAGAQRAAQFLQH
jgi:AAA domain